MTRISLFTFFMAVCANAQSAPAMLQTESAKLAIDNKGWVTSIVAIDSGKEYSPAGHPSPLLSLHESNTPNDKVIAPQSAVHNAVNGTITLKYSNGASAVVKVVAKDKYFRFQLVSLESRGTVDNIVWGPLNTTISKIIGDIIGVVRDDVWAIGMYGIDDNTIAGPVTDGDCYGMGYYIHSPDPLKYPLPPQYKEGQWFNIGGDGINDYAFYSRPEEYFCQVFGNGAKLEPEFGSSLAYHARDRRKPYTHKFSLLPGFKRSRPRTMMSDPVEGVDLIGSAVAIYACHDGEGLKTIETIIKSEGLPYITIDGKWVRDPTLVNPTMYWKGPVDKCIEYTKALGLKDISRDTPEFYPSRNTVWQGRVESADGKSMSYKEFADEAHKNGLTHGGLHALCLFLQPGISSDVTPVASENLQTVCRTKLAKNISDTDTEIEVTEPAFLAEKGTWTCGDGGNYIRIGGEILGYESISEAAPYVLKGIKRGYASTKAQPHKSGDELVKLVQNCYNGFVPDMKLLLDYAEYYAKLMADNGMASIGFDGYESLMYQNHGYYAMKIFNRRFFEAYAKLNGGRYPRVTGSNIFPGAWEFMNVCDLGSGNSMFDPISGRRGIEGKDIGNGFRNSYLPGTFGIQHWVSEWSLYDVENLQAKAIGWDSSYALSTSQDLIDKTGDKDAIFMAFRAWQEARAAQVFSKAHKEMLRDPDHKFHIEQTGAKSFTLYPIKVLGIKGVADGKLNTVTNPQAGQPLHLEIRLRTTAQALANNVTVTLPNGSQIRNDKPMKDCEFIIVKNGSAYSANNHRMKVDDLKLVEPVALPSGEATFGVAASPGVSYELTVWAMGKGERLGV